MTVLRSVQDGDAPQIALYCGDKDLAWMTARIPHPYPEEAAREFCTFSQSALGRNWAVTENGGEIIGMVGSSLDGNSADVGYWIGAPFAGKGHASRAVRMLVEKMFVDPDVHSLTACVYQDNPASARVLVKAGFAPGPDCVGPSLARGPGTYPTWTFALHRAAWEAAS